MSRSDFDTREELADDLAGFLTLSLVEVRDRLDEGNWQRVALIYTRLLELMEEGASYFARARRIRQNPEWAPGRPIRAELKLARINAKVDRVEHQLLDALNIDLRDDERQPLPLLAPRGPAYFVPVLEEEADRLETEAQDQES